jgi:hypothetical protein
VYQDNLLIILWLLPGDFSEVSAENILRINVRHHCLASGANSSRAPKLEDIL